MVVLLFFQVVLYLIGLMGMGLNVGNSSMSATKVIGPGISPNRSKPVTSLPDSRTQDEHRPKYATKPHRSSLYSYFLTIWYVLRLSVSA